MTKSIMGTLPVKTMKTLLYYQLNPAVPGGDLTIRPMALDSH